MDLYVIPKGAKHVDLAEKFLDYICTPEVMAKNLDEFPYSCPNDAAVEAASRGSELLVGTTVIPRPSKTLFNSLL